MNQTHQNTGWKHLGSEAMVLLWYVILTVVPSVVMSVRLSVSLSVRPSIMLRVSRSRWVKIREQVHKNTSGFSISFTICSQIIYNISIPVLNASFSACRTCLTMTIHLSVCLSISLSLSDQLKGRKESHCLQKTKRKTKWKKERTSGVRQNMWIAVSRDNLIFITSIFINLIFNHC